MRWPIRNQILLPFVAIQVVTVAAIAVSFAWIAVRQVEEEITLRVSNVLSTLRTASYPLTPAVLDQLRSLSGAHFVVIDEQGAPTASTMAADDVWIAELSRQPWRASESEILGNLPTLTLDGERYFAGRVPVRRAPGPTTSVLVLYPVRSWALARWQAMFPPLAIGGGLLVLTVVASMETARRIGRRIQNVERQVGRIAGGDFAPVPMPGVDDELRDLAESINRMAAALDESMRSIRENERSSLLRQLVGGLAHQLRNALTGARASIQLHRRRCTSQDGESIEVALKQLTLTEEQIKALLRLTRGECGTPCPGVLGELLDETVSLVRPICAHRRIDFSYECGAMDARVSDADAIRGALLNLMMNAVDAARPGGAVGVRAEKGPDEGIVIEVFDNGPGVPAEMAEDVFTPFFTTKSEGVGLGLALARKATQDCGGALEWHRQDGLTVFRLALPRRAGVGPAVAGRAAVEA